MWGIGNDTDNYIDGTNILSAILSWSTPLERDKKAGNVKTIKLERAMITSQS